ncbi:DUF928 domain-containing protein [Lyngbya aestuarii]|uniref:DUF928 domain-containing protein n=1 Tax=Lyngbya aestuarii TaxID=118322 RepID=UPI00403DD8B6
MSQIRCHFLKFSLGIFLKLFLITAFLTLVQAPQELLAKEIPKRWQLRENPQSGSIAELLLGKEIAQTPLQLNYPSLSRRLPAQWENSLTPKPPGSSRPSNTEGGATRGPDGYDSCLQAGQSPVALVPASGMGQTIAEYPTIFWYMPSTSASAVEFVLKESNDQEIYSTKYSLVNSNGSISTTPSIRSLTLPSSANLSPLKINQEYQWQLALVCDPLDRGADILISGRIKRVKPDPLLAIRFSRATLQERLTLYADARLWYETLGTLVDLRRNQPNDPNLAAAWKKLLDSAKIDKISQDPFYQGARNISNQ